jgi:peroxiredoxin
VTRQRQRFLVSLVVVGAVSIGGGWLLSRGGDSDTTNDGVISLVPGSTAQDPTIGTNAPVTGTLFPEVTLTDLDGEPVALSDRGGRPAVINFWFSTCEPCKREFPALVAAFNAHGSNIDFIGINPNDSPEVARDFAADYGVEYTLLRDPDGEAVAALGVGTFPITLFVDAGGVIVRQHAGEITQKQLTEYLDTYLGAS